MTSTTMAAAGLASVALERPARAAMNGHDISDVGWSRAVTRTGQLFTASAW